MANPFVHLRRRLFSAPMLGFVRKVLPPLSETESAALEAGSVWWDAELFSGNPDWSKLLAPGPYGLTDEEQAFIDGPVDTLCAMLDEWRITFEERQLPHDAFEFMKAHGFFGIIIPKEYGGLGFSAAAHSEIVSRISTVSLTGAITVMVPNSLGPGELLMLYGTQAQRDHYLPRLASGQDIPCFGLTSETAGSDAAGMEDVGIVCEGEHDGESVLGIRLNFAKRYITLAPIATVMGLAFKLRDPDGLLGGEEELGITVALVPASAPGVSIGRRHYPAFQPFANGPIEGRDVFVPLDAIIGGRERAGDGWRMLMGALAAGRGISLPALSTGSAKFSAHATGAYARVREQFGLPVGKFEGVQEALARIAATAYELEAARRLTAQAIDAGEKPAVISAIMKAHATERMRQSVNDAMDLPGGKGSGDGPKNYLGSAYRAIPIGITVEGANILTRSLIIFGQGAIRCHPYLLDEMHAAQNPDKAQGLADFDVVLSRHLGHQFATAFRAYWRALTFGRTVRASEFGALAPYVRRLTRYSATLAFMGEIALVSLGGELKRMEMISARLGDVLSELYIASAVAARFRHDGQQEADLPLARLSLENALHRIEQALDGVIANYPSRTLAALMRPIAFPWGRRRRPALDVLRREAAEILLAPSAARDRLVDGIYLGEGDDEIALLTRAFVLAHESAPLRRKLKDAKCETPEAALAAGVITAEEKALLDEADRLARAVIAVDDFAEDALCASTAGDGPVPSAKRAAS
ncbi:MAG: acyl-CoA dehydrogenase [Oceanicaulis sp.]|nr:acyl-CoA dehydrogenase [Oceanicaulis sp.]